MNRIEIFIERGRNTRIELNLGDPKTPVPYPTLGEYLELQHGVDTDNPEELWAYLIDVRCQDPDEISRQKANGIAPVQLLGTINAPLAEESFEARQWLEWTYVPEESPAAQMYHFLTELDIDTPGIDCIEGDRPGSNYTYSSASDRGALNALKESLENKGYNVVVREFEW